MEELGDQRQSLRHNKYVNIDRLDVWMGSLNLTTLGASRNDNNLIHIRTTELAENYTLKFKEMFVQAMFGDIIISHTVHPALVIDDTSFKGSAAQIIAAQQNAPGKYLFF